MRALKLRCFHRHQWETVSVSHTQPIHSLKVGSVTGSSEDLERHRRWCSEMTDGVTHVVQCCSQCGSLKSYRLSGIHNFQSANAGKSQPANEPAEERQKQKDETSA